MQNISVLTEIEQKEKTNPHDLSLNLKSFSPEERRFISEQIECRQKAIKKLPYFYANRCFYRKRAFEQSSSEAVAKYKTKFIFGEQMLDLCGGLGVDDFWFSKSFNKVISYDPDKELNEIVQHNNKLLNCTNHERITGTAEEVSFDKTPSNTIVYLDPDRRDSHGRRQYLPENHSPNIYPILEKINGRLKVYIKLSPMIDITLLLKNIPDITGLWVISNKLENKEILIECNGEHQKGIWAVEIGNTILELPENPNSKAKPDFDYNKKYLFIPSPAILKSKIGETLASEHNLDRINSSFQFLFGNSSIPGFMGRSFKIVSILEYKPKLIKNELKKLKIEKAELFARNFYHSSEEVARILKIKKGGNHFIAFTMDNDKKPYVIICHLSSQNQ